MSKSRRARSQSPSASACAGSIHVAGARLSPQRNSDAECVEFLQWALPRLGMRWPGFRKVRRQVCKRLRRRVLALGLEDAAAYRSYLERHPDEWRVLETLTHVTISRFNRDQRVFAFVQQEILPALAAHATERGVGVLHVWSAGCASGEEAYSLSLIWQLELAPRFPGLKIRVLATDIDDAMLARARRGCFTAASLRELSEPARAAAFERRERVYCLHERFKAPVTIARHDIRSPPPDGRFDLVLCRNLAFTHFDLDGQRATAARLAGALRPGGALVVGQHEAPPAALDDFEPWSATHRVYRRRGSGCL